MQIPPFQPFLDYLTASPTLKNHGISDSLSTLSYLELREFCQRCDTHLENQGVRKSDCIAVECDMSLSGAAIICALLYRGQNFMLIPVNSNSLPAALPDFCPLSLNGIGSAHEIDRITLTPNSIFNPSSAAQISGFFPNSGSLFLRSSGSMGAAKIILFAQDQLINNARNCIPRFTLTAESRIMITVPVFHMYGLGAALIPALITGANISLLANANILRFTDSIKRLQPDILYLNPTLLAMILQGWRSNHSFTRTISAGSFLSAELYHSYWQRIGALVNLYGSTEMGALASTTEQADNPNRLIPFPGVEMIVNEKSELFCRHPYGFEGYFTPSGEPIPGELNPYKTGDIARYTPSGEIEILGRQADSTNRSGFLVWCAEIENALLRTGLVTQAVVLSGQEDTLRGKKLYAFCIPATEQTSPQTIREQCSAYLPRYAVPDEFILGESFPLLATGKINRGALLRQIMSTN